MCQAKGRKEGVHSGQWRGRASGVAGLAAATASDAAALTAPAVSCCDVYRWVLMEVMCGEIEPCQRLGFPCLRVMCLRVRHASDTNAALDVQMYTSSPEIVTFKARSPIQVRLADLKTRPPVRSQPSFGKARTTADGTRWRAFINCAATLVLRI
jgi:hypothetical protein